MTLTMEEMQARVNMLTRQIGFWMQEREELKQRIRDLVGEVHDGSAMQPLADRIADRLQIPRVVVPVVNIIDDTQPYWTTEHSMAQLVLAFINARP